MTWESAFSSQHPKLEEKVAQVSATLAELRAEPRSPEQGEVLVLLVRHRAAVEQTSGTASPRRHTVSLRHSKESFRPQKLVGSAARTRTAGLLGQMDSRSYELQGFSA